MVLKACPNVSLSVRARLEKRIGPLGDRVVEVPQISLQDYVRLFGGAHVALEPFPFGGSITSLDAFEGGAPVVALAPQAGRPALTVALYAIAGVDCCVAATVEAYADLAVDIAKSPAKRAAASAAIAGGRDRLYESAAAVREVEDFFERALRSVAAAAG